jgi:prepilin-type processing-associated H-X9-DG protein
MPAKTVSTIRPAGEVVSAPCVAGAGDTTSFSGARSRHAGGISALFGDGSVRFHKNSINAATWIGINTISSGEVVSSDSY